MSYETFRFGDPDPCTVINARPATPPLTVPIVGVPRGGTTMVAAVVHALGVDLGPVNELVQFTFEDQTMNRAQLGLQLSYIARRNQECRVWGWKDPSAIQTVQSLFFALRNPRVIVVFRDLMASIQAEMAFDETKNIQPRRTFRDLATATIAWWQANMEFAANTTFPVLLVSYERAVKKPGAFITAVAQFLGLSPTATQLAEATARINVSGGYIVLPPDVTPPLAQEPTA